MGLNQRYLIISFAAIFMALGIGLLVGMSLANDGTLVQRQEALISSLEADFVLLQGELANLRNELRRANLRASAADTFAQAVNEYLASDRLQGYRVAIVQTDSQIQRALVGTLKQAGAQVLAVVQFSAVLPTNADPPGWDRPVWGSQALSAGEALATGLYACLNDGQTDLLQNLARAGVLGVLEETSAAGTSGPCPVAVLFVGPWPAAGQELLHSAITALQRQGCQLVAAEPLGTDGNGLAFFRSFGISTVNHLDCPGGELAVVLSLAGANGSFGYGRGADDGIIPCLGGDAE
ncbi:MAG TPA: copper transporter [Firmicutes bacterium]|nr:copper transporter [Bacillota bacterium]